MEDECVGSARCLQGLQKPGLARWAVGESNIRPPPSLS